MGRVLIVDDLEDNVVLLKAQLQQQGHAVATASDGEEALRLARAEPPEIIVSDILMPGMDGFALCRAWQADKVLAEIPFIFYSATYTDREDREFALSLGATRFFEKPADPDVFGAAIIELLDDYQAGNLERPDVQPSEDVVYLKEYNQRLIHKLEEKLFELQDVSDQVEAQEAYWRIVTETSPTVVVVVDEQGVIRFMSTGRPMPDHEKMDRAGHHLIDLVHPDDREGARREVARLFAEGTMDAPYPLRARAANDSYRHLEVLGAAHDPPTGGRLLVLSLHDVTERERAEAEIRGRDARTRGIVDNALDCIVSMDETGAIVEFNRAAEQTFGYERDVVLGRSVHDVLIPSEEHEIHRGALERHLQTGHTKILGERREVLGQRADGTLFPLEITATRDDSLGTPYFTAFMRDLSDKVAAQEERDRLEKELVQAQKLRTVGTLAAGVAHDFNNILVPILGFAELIQGELDEDSEMFEAVGWIKEAGERGRSLVKQILTFSRQVEPESRPVQMAKVIQEASELLRASLPSTVRIVTDIEPGVPRVLADTTQILQALMNLGANASHAMRENGGLLTFSLSRVDLAEGLRDHERFPGGQAVRITVSDSGDGIDPQDLERVFEPFFTTKEAGDGTGLGLSVLHGIVEAHRGSVELKSTLGVGTQVIIDFPVIASDESATREPAPDMPTGTGRILVADDEPLIVGLVKRMLEAKGYEVVTTGGSTELLAEFRADPSHWDLILTDQTMPGMTGLSLAAEVRASGARTPIVIMTGHADGLEKDELKALGIRECVPKPFKSAEITEAIKRALNGSG